MKYGVDKVDIFQTNDLSEKKDVANVTNTLYALGRAVSNILLELHTILRFLNISTYLELCMTQQADFESWIG